jgi:hypothetical protein
VSRVVNWPSPGKSACIFYGEVSRLPIHMPTNGTVIKLSHHLAATDEGVHYFLREIIHAKRPLNTTMERVKDKRTVQVAFPVHCGVEEV